MKIETYDVGEMFVAESGGGVTIEQIVTTLRLLYMGGIKIDEKIVNHVQVDPGPFRYFRVTRHTFQPEHQATTLGQVWESLKQQRLECITYEIALRWFLAAPSYHLWQARDANGKIRGRIAVLPPNAVKVNGKPQVMVITRGGDGPAVWLFDADLDRPPQGDFLTALEVNPTPFSR